MIKLLILSALYSVIQSQCENFTTPAKCHDYGNSTVGYCFWYDPAQVLPNQHISTTDFCHAPAPLPEPLKCYPVTWYTNCSLITNKRACEYGLCKWSSIKNQCGKLSSLTCEEYDASQCYYGLNCERVTLAGGKEVCQTKQICTTYVGQDPSKCVPITTVVPCSQRTYETYCLSSMCLWLQSAAKCVEYYDPLVSCDQLSTTTCKYNTRCSINKAIDECQDYRSCDVPKTVDDCNNYEYLNCYYDTFFQQCKPVSGQTWCVDLNSKKSCDYALCIWDETQSPPQCIQLYSASCSLITTQFKCNYGVNCLWVNGTCEVSDDFAQICAVEITSEFCYNHQECYFDNTQFQCLATDSSVPCSLITYEASCMFAKCVWDPKYNMCFEYYATKCELLEASLCHFGTNCYLEESTSLCKTDRNCEMNDDDINACYNDPLGCYFDPEVKKCSQVGVKLKVSNNSTLIASYTPCNDLITQSSCLAGRCSWTTLNPLQGTGICYNLVDSPCENLYSETCQYSLKCYWNTQLNECSYLPFCFAYNNQKTNCESSSMNCWYCNKTNECYAIDGDTYCSDVVGVNNCLKGSCVLIKNPQNASELQCLEFIDTPCPSLSNSLCHFRNGNCTLQNANKTCDYIRETSEEEVSESSEETEVKYNIIYINEPMSGQIMVVQLILIILLLI